MIEGGVFMKKINILFFSGILFLASNSEAQVPTQINFQQMAPVENLDDEEDGSEINIACGSRLMTEISCSLENSDEPAFMELYVEGTESVDQIYLYDEYAYYSDNPDAVNGASCYRDNGIDTLQLSVFHLCNRRLENGEYELSHQVKVYINTYGGNDKINAHLDQELNYISEVQINSGYGNDTVLGSNIHDTINGGPGHDHIGGYGGNDTIRGGPGNDRLAGNAGNDTINGEGGNDSLFGDIASRNNYDSRYNNGGNDTLNGGPGNDCIDGYGGTNTMDGGGGRNTIADWQTTSSQNPPCTNFPILE